jgi:hypothetical protein
VMPPAKQRSTPSAGGAAGQAYPHSVPVAGGPVPRASSPVVRRRGVGVAPAPVRRSAQTWAAS